MRRVVVLGPGAAGKSTLARRLGAVLGIEVVELDALFWTGGSTPMSRDRFAEVHGRLIRPASWIVDGDLGPYDAFLPERLAAADTILLLDFPRWRCLWRSFRRGRESLDYWLWVLTWRNRWRPRTLRAIAAHAPGAQVRVLRSPAEVAAFVDAASGALRRR